MRGLDQVALAFVGDERRDVADYRRLVREPERLVHVHSRHRCHVIDVDALVHRGDAIRGDAVRQEHLPNRLGGGDETVDLPMLPSRQ
jgi:hypothetical protein